MKLFVCVFLAVILMADEGMWPFHAIPVDRIKERYNVELSGEWIERVQKSCVRISSGGSGSFVSKDGLILTNHHVGESAIYHLSTKKRDLIKKGFFARSFNEELKCPNLYADRLVEMRDVTDEVNRKVGSAGDFKEREKMRKALYAQIKKSAQEETGLQPEIVVLYRGAKIFLYLYERFSDIRLVMAPEKEVAFFGGDPENFEYPRTNYDFCFFRAYKDDRPLQIDSYLKWSQSGPEGGEPLFVTGHPGSTGRSLTSAHLQFLKDYGISNRRKWLQERRDRLEDFSKKSAENARIALSDFGSLQNTLKVLNSFTDEKLSAIIAEKKIKEKDLDAESLASLASALEEAKAYWKTYLLLEGGATSQLFSWAKQFVRLSEELAKPNAQRLQEYTDSELKTLQEDLLSEEPVYSSLESVKLKDYFARVMGELGAGHPVSQILAKTDVERLLEKTQMNDLAFRKNLYEQIDLVKKSEDPMIVLTRELDPYAREMRQKKEDGLDGIQNEIYAKLAQDEFSRWGESVYPDATFTLRLAVGTMKGYEEKGAAIQPMTHLGLLFEQANLHNNQEPYSIPKRWRNKEGKLNRNEPLNFVSTNDIIGGNSGSPVINRKGELVGLIFDGNRYSNIWFFRYDDVQGRSISVHSRGILDSLRNVYQAKRIVKELVTEKESF